MPSLSEMAGHTRRQFIGGALGVFALMLLEQEQELAALTSPADAATAPTPLLNPVKVTFRVNGATRTLELDSRVALLDALRERLGLTGSMKGCDQGQCGACTVIVDGRRVLSCLTLTATLEGKDVTTIEGLARGDELHPMQAAFIKYELGPRLLPTLGDWFWERGTVRNWGHVFFPLFPHRFWVAR